MAAGTSPNPLQITVQAGYHGSSKAGEWMPVTIDVTNSGADVEGTVEVQTSGGSQGGPPISDAIYQVPLSLAAGTTKHLRVYVASDPIGGGTVTVRIVQNGRVLIAQDAPTTNAAAALIGVLSDQPTALDDFGAVHPGGVAAVVVHLRPEDISDSSMILRAFDMLVIDDYATDTLTQGQRTAIAGYVENGGFVMVGTGAAWHKTLAGLPSEMLPMQVTGTTMLGSSHFVSGTGSAEVATGTITGGRAWLSEGGQPLLLEKASGSGFVVIATFDWNQAPVFGASGTDALLRQVMARALFGGATVQISPMGFSGAGLAARSGNLISALGNLPSLDLPSLQLTGVLVALYVLVVGPINYFVLGRLRRRALAWITVPLIAIVAAGGAYGTGLLTKGRSVQTNQVSIVHLQAGWDRAYQETYTGVVPPTRGDYSVRVNADGMLISPISTNYSGPFPAGISSSSVGAIRVHGGSVDMPGMTAFTLRGFATEGLTSAPSLTGSLQLVNGTLVGTIQNRSSTSFTDAVLVAGDSFQQLGALKPGATANIKLVPVVTAFGGPPVWMTIYSNSAFAGGNQPATSTREGDAKTQILALLPLGAGFKGFTSTVSPILVAWTKQSFEQVTVNGSQPRSEALTAVALSLPVDQVGAGPLPPGIVTGRLVDLDGGQQGGPLPQMITLTNGTATYEFTPPLAAGKHLTAAVINSTNPLGAKGVPPGSTNSGATPTLTGEVWDWSHSAWVAINYQDNATTALPDWAVEPSTGQVRLRLTASNANGGTLTGAVSLTGTVR
jgi:hypothetical protein